MSLRTYLKPLNPTLAVAMEDVKARIEVIRQKRDSGEMTKEEYTKEWLSLNRTYLIYLISNKGGYTPSTRRARAKRTKIDKILMQHMDLVQKEADDVKDEELNDVERNIDDLENIIIEELQEGEVTS